MTLSNLPGPWRWERREANWWRINDRLQIEDGPHPQPIKAAEDDIMPPYRTKTGKWLTDEDIEALADEAERGYDVSQLSRSQNSRSVTRLNALIRRMKP